MDFTNILEGGRSNFLNYESITEVCNSILLDKGSLLDNVMTGAKILGVAFVVLYWIKEYLKGLDSNDADKKNGITIYSIGKGVAYILVIVNFNVLLDMCDNGLASYQNSLGLSVSDNIYDAFNEDWMEMEEDAIANAEEDAWYDGVVDIASSVGNMVMNAVDVWWWLLQILRGVSWLINVMIMPIFLLERGFLLLIMKVAFPLILALGANEVYRNLLTKWILLYCAVFMTGPFFIIATNFCDEAYRLMMSSAIDDNLSKLIAFSVVVFAKVKLYKGAIELSYKIFQS